MTTSQCLDPGPCYIHEDDYMVCLPPGQSEEKPQCVLQAPKPLPKTSHSRDVKRRCVKFIVVAVIFLLLAGTLLAYYFSSSCMHGMQCGDGRCVWESQWCDGVMDCQGGQDEANCVRTYGSSFLLQVYSAQVKSWRTVCSHGWTDQQGRASCHTMGYSRGTYFKSGQQKTDSDDGFLIVKSDFNPEVFILQQLMFRNTCPNSSVVTLRCTDCGRGMNTSRASRGQMASPGSWPWQVSLQVAGFHRCGGAIISTSWIVTTAHCVAWASSPGDWAVYAGIVDPLDTLFNPVYSVSRIIAHEGYNSFTLKNDIALMKLTKPVDITVSSNIRPVCLPNVGLNISVPQKAWKTQFDCRVNGDSGSLYLTRAQVSLVHAADCNSIIIFNGGISQDMMCAREMESTANTCQADSGGPLVTQKGRLWWLIGDNIWGGQRHEQSKPGVYGNITYFLDWIFCQMKKHQDD
uniref:Transmembrane serine protease 2 n=1 Tax=Monopterus albus TaxID=43700 RepID=A0A3Q3J5U9_MONAL|nr:transmembrane protease serine 2-like [Monopterus albus]